MLLSIPSDSIAKAIFASLLLFGSFSMGTAQNLEDHPLLSNNAGSVRAGRGLAEKATKTPKAPTEITTKAPKAPKGATLAPTPSPSTFPSSVPSETPCYDESQVTELLEILGEISDICLMLTEGTPQNLAYVYVRDYPYDLTLASSTNAEWHERFALAVFYYSITSDPYDFFGGWVPTSPATDECDWSQVYCSNSVVEYLSMEYYEMEGTVPIEMAGLSALTYLSLPHNSLSTPNYLGAWGNLVNLKYLDVGRIGLGTVPSEFGNLNALETLLLTDNELTSLPTELGNLFSIMYLYAKGNSLTSLPTHFGNLASLVQLVLDRNSLSSFPTELGNLSSLTSLSASENSLTSLPTHFGNLAALGSLSLDQNSLSSLPTELGNLDSLALLSLYQNALTSLPSELGKLVSLGSLDSSTNLLTSLPSELGNLNALITLNVRQNNLVSLPTEFGNMGAVTRLNLNRNSLTSLPTELGNLSNLKFMFVEDNDPSLVVPSSICDLLSENGGNLLTLKCGNDPYYYDLDCCI